KIDAKDSRRWLKVFFFQAEDGIRDKLVTGVQTCALPISREELTAPAGADGRWAPPRASCSRPLRVRRSAAAERDRRPSSRTHPRSEERRVGKEGSTGWWAES